MKGEKEESHHEKEEVKLDFMKSLMSLLPNAANKMTGHPLL